MCSRYPAPMRARYCRSCMRLADGLRAWQKEPELQNAALQILGPAAAPVLMVNKRYRYRITVLGRSCPALRKMVGFLLQERPRRSIGIGAYPFLRI